MTTDKIIAAALASGFTEQEALTVKNDLAKFYDIAYRAGMERAAEICDHGAEAMLHGFKREGAARCAESIRAHAKNQPESTHDTSNV